MKAKLKRLLSCLLTAALLLQMAPFEVLAADSSPTASSSPVSPPAAGLRKKLPG